jgi:formate hydrogenlyase transcriptional activator
VIRWAQRRYFVTSHAKRMGRHIETIPDQTMQALVKWRWPGNVRELEDFIERLVILSPGPVLRAPLAELESVEESAPVDANLEATECEHILRVLRECEGMIGGTNGAAERLGLKRTTLNSKLKKLGISGATIFSPLKENLTNTRSLSDRNVPWLGVGCFCNHMAG